MNPKYKPGDMIAHRWNSQSDPDLYLVLEAGETHYKLVKVSSQRIGTSDIHLIDKMNEVFRI